MATKTVNNNQQWIDRVLEHRDKLRALIVNYHPASRGFRQGRQGMPITAPGAEAACEVVRQQIKQEHAQDPASRFDAALASGDVYTIYGLLQSAWFGVPESTSCWSIPGFGEAVDLLDDPPEVQS